jgi:hypothetical protein
VPIGVVTLRRLTFGRAAESVASDGENFYLCPSCGQAVDARDLGQVLYHEIDGHEPLRDY